MSGEQLQFALPKAVGTCIGCLLLTVLLPVAQANSTAPRDVLTEQKGLVEHLGNWVLPLELELRREIASLKPLHQTLLKSKQELGQTYQLAVQRNAAVEGRIKQLNVQLQLRLAQDASNLGAVQRRILSEQINLNRTQLEELQRQWIEPAQLAGIDPLKRQVIKLTIDRNALATALLQIHDGRQSIANQYERLAQDPATQSALRKLGGKQQLGPLEDYFSMSFIAKLATYEREVFTSELPLYREGSDLRVSGLIGLTPVTFTWLDSSEPTMLTASVIEATGLEVPKNAPRMQRRLPDGRQITVRQFEVPYLRFGKQVLRSVSVLALPPEAENVGTQIGPGAFEGLTPKAEPEKLRLLLN